MKPLQAGELTIEPELTSGVMHVRWLGKSNERDPGRILKPYLDEALSEAERDGSRIDMHFEKLEHFNSSTIAVLIQLINHARERKIALTLIYDRSLKWQSLSFEALKRALQPFNGGGPATVNIRSV